MSSKEIIHTDRLHISLVSYLNSYPFHFGLLKSNVDAFAHAEIIPPAQCAENFISGKSNIALVPVGALTEIPTYNLIQPFCIAASGEVKSVFLQSRKPLSDVRKIALDSASRSSNLLTKVLCKHCWNIFPEFMDSENEADARVIIGDKALNSIDEYPIRVDLAFEWHKQFGLPFVFAVWIAHESVSEEIISKLNIALDFGVSQIEQAVQYFGSAGISYSAAVDYLKHNIVYRLNQSSHESMALFLRLATEIAEK